MLHLKMLNQVWKTPCELTCIYVSQLFSTEQPLSQSISIFIRNKAKWYYPFSNRRKTIGTHLISQESHLDKHSHIKCV